LHRLVWRPLLVGKFGPHYADVNMAWLWARLHVRSFRLGYFRGGFQSVVDTLTAAVQAQGGQVRLNAPVQAIAPAQAGGLTLHLADGPHDFDQVLHTGSPGLLARLAPDLPSGYLAGLQRLKSMGAVVLVLALRRQLLTDGTYWLNLPAESADKAHTDIPFLALVEHTNYIDRAHYGGDHIVYCGDYVTPDHPYLSMSREALEALFLPALVKFNPQFDPAQVRASWLFRTPYAQPVPELNHSQHIPDLQTPWPGLWMANMSQVYPWDRGTNFAVEIGRNVARRIIHQG
jgi:protoporphyrinogen oxidase